MDFVNRGRGRFDLTLVHVSDFHFCEPRGAPIRSFVGKRGLSLLSWQLRRRRDHAPGILERLARAIAALESDLRVVTGDLVQLALPAEFRRAAEVLASLGGPREVFAVPGNHDALVGAAAEAQAPLWNRYAASDGGRPGFPALRICGPAALIGVSTAHPTPPLSAAGSIGCDQARRLDTLLAETGREGLYRILLIHHPPFSRGVSPHKRLRDLPRLLALIARRGAELVLHGHTHRTSCVRIPGPRGAVPVLGIAAASCGSRDPARRSAFRLLRLEARRGGVRAVGCDFRYEPACGAFRPQETYPL